MEPSLESSTHSFTLSCTSTTCWLLWDQNSKNTCGGNTGSQTCKWYESLLILFKVDDKSSTKLEEMLVVIFFNKSRNLKLIFFSSEITFQFASSSLSSSSLTIDNRFNLEWPSCIQLNYFTQTAGTLVGRSASHCQMPSSSTCCLMTFIR